MMPEEMTVVVVAVMIGMEMELVVQSMKAVIGPGSFEEPLPLPDHFQNVNHRGDGC